MLNFITLHVMSVLENLHSQNQSLSYNSVMLFASATSKRQKFVIAQPLRCNWTIM